MAGSAPAAATATRSSSAGTNTNYLAPLSVLTTLFFMWGFLTSLNDILSPHLKQVFELSHLQAQFVQTAFFAAYFVMSVPSGSIVKKIGYKSGIIVGLLGAAAGCVLFYPAASARSYPLFLLALYVLGSGITLLQVAANPFVAVLGKPESSSSRLTLTQAFNSLGTTIGPEFGKWVFFSSAVLGAEELAKMAPAALEKYKLGEAALVQTPYLVLAGALVALAIAIAAFKLPKIEETADADAAVSGDDKHASAWSYRHLVLGAVAIFVYVGAEVAIGNNIVSYFREPYMGGLSNADASSYVKFYWGGAMVGRFIGSLFTLRAYRPGKALAGHAIGAAALTVLSVLTTGFLGRWSLLAIGLFNSIMFPTIFTLAIDGLGRHTRQGSGILCTAIVGGALIPPVLGFFADQGALHQSFLIAAVCYVYIAWYGAKGSAPAAARA
ncbi:MAG TPA: L-fucose:H+ symporter permease [Polyangia bacterium]|nr:L-fucose:H+ symporter permease [Polyangia bacterium]